MAELRNQALIEAKKGEKSVKLVFESDMSLAEAFDLVTEIRGYIVNRIVEIQNADKPKTEETPKV
jgi:uncharacterized protein YajQ (UPF0234 family)